MTTNRAIIAIGKISGHHFAGECHLIVARHAERRFSDGTVDRGFFCRRKWLADRVLFEFDAKLGWAYEHWFEFPDSSKENP